MIETTNTTKHIVLDQRSESEKSISADLGQVVQKSDPKKQQNIEVPNAEVPIVKVTFIKEADYVDPISKDYRRKRENELGTIKNRESQEGIKSLHETFHFIGDQPEY